MLYSNNYFAKEIRQKYSETKMGLRYLLLYGLFLGLITFSLHFLLQTVYESVLATKFPEFMSQSYHTVLYTYLFVSCIFFLLYFFVNYNYITFYEIRCNRWYLLKKLGYKGSSMIFSKSAAIIISIMVIYTTGFITSILLTVFLKYNFITSYFIPMYLVGCINILFIAMMITIGSLFIVDKDTVKYYIATVAFSLYLLQTATNYFVVVKNRVLMQDVRNLFYWNRCSFVPISVGLIFIGLVLCWIIAFKASSHYHYSLKKDTINIKLHRGFDFLLYSILTIFLVACSAIQLFILSISFASPDREISYRGTIPYVFQSSTMEDEINKNDLIYFQRLDIQAPLAVGDIVIFKEDSQVFVERIISIMDDYVTVDIDHYPKDSKEGVMVKSIPRSSIYGKYYASHPYLGAFILFANTTIGRFLFLVLPSLLLFFNRQIRKRIRSITYMQTSGGSK